MITHKPHMFCLLFKVTGCNARICAKGLPVKSRPPCRSKFQSFRRLQLLPPAPLGPVNTGNPVVNEGLRNGFPSNDD